MQRYYKPFIIAAIILLTLPISLYDRTSITPDTTSEHYKQVSDQMVPDVTFTLLEGGTISLYSLSGHTVWLHFWASWCVPCREEFLGLLKRLEKEDNTILLAVSADTNAENARRFMVPYRRDFQALFENGTVLIAQDATHKIIEGTFQTFKYPETIIIRPDLKMQKKIVGVFAK